MILFICISFLLLFINIHYLFRNEKVYKMLKRMSKYTSKTVTMDINNNFKPEQQYIYDLYNDLYSKEVNQVELVLSLTINLEKFEKNFMDKIDKIYLGE